MNDNAFDPIHRPGLAHQHAFDWLATHLAAADGSVACLTDSTFIGAELLRRLPAVAFFSPIPEGLGHAAKALGIIGPKTIDKTAPCSAVAWLEPTVSQQEQFTLVQQALRPGGRLYLVVGGRLTRFLADRRLGPGQPRRLSASQVKRLLRQNQYRTCEEVGWHGLRAIWWHLLSQLWLRLNRLDRRDRCQFAMRQAFTEVGFGRQVVALSGIVAGLAL